MKGILEGVKHMTENHLMHRDLKPDNILFKNSSLESCVITDFGLGS